MTLVDAVSERLRERLQGSGPGADEAVARLIEAAALGLPALAGPLTAEVQRRLQTEPRLSVALAALDRLVMLHSAAASYGALHHPSLPPLVSAAWDRAISLLDELPRQRAEAEPEILGGLRALGQAGLEARPEQSEALDEAPA